MTDPIMFAFAVTAILATPGPTNTLLATSGAVSGLRCSLPLVPAELAGYLIAIVTIGFVVNPIISTLPMLAALLRLAVAIYMGILAIRLWQRGALEIVGRRLVGPRDVFVTTLLNPKAIIFATGVVPLHHPDSGAYVAAFSGLLVCISVAWIGIGSAIGRGALSRFGSSIVPRLGAAAICAFATALVVRALD